MCKRARACANISREINGFLTVSGTAVLGSVNLPVMTLAFHRTTAGRGTSASLTGRSHVLVQY